MNEIGREIQGGRGIYCNYDGCGAQKPCFACKRRMAELVLGNVYEKGHLVCPMDAEASQSVCPMCKNAAPCMVVCPECNETTKR